MVFKYVVFSDFKIRLIIYHVSEKLKEFNAKQAIEGQGLSDEKLEAVVKLTANGNKTIADVESINTLMSLLQWPDSIVFPVIDIARLAVLQPSVNDKLCSDKLVNLLKRHLSNSAMAANQMLSFRLLANMFAHEAGEKLCLRHNKDLLTSILELTTPVNKNTQVRMPLTAHYLYLRTLLVFRMVFASISCPTK